MHLFQGLLLFRLLTFRIMKNYPAMPDTYITSMFCISEQFTNVKIIHFINICFSNFKIIDLDIFQGKLSENSASVLLSGATIALLLFWYNYILLGFVYHSTHHKQLLSFFNHFPTFLFLFTRSTWSFRYFSFNL